MTEYLRIVMADPAGNRTAIVRTRVPSEKRAKIAALIMEDNELRAEQVGFETQPLFGGAGRLEMMGGEFCGNAARSYGYLIWREKLLNGEKIREAEQEREDEAEKGTVCRGEIRIEISGAQGLLRTACEGGGPVGRSYARMPIPVGLKVSEEGYPLVVSEGIAHMILLDTEPDEKLAESLIRHYGKSFPAFGLQFISGDSLIPLVYVAEAGSLVWESSCGSGTLAAAWYLEQKKVHKEGLPLSYSFREPGGILDVRFFEDEDGKLCAEMGGSLSLEDEIDFPISFRA